MMAFDDIIGGIEEKNVRIEYSDPIPTVYVCLWVVIPKGRDRKTHIEQWAVSAGLTPDNNITLQCPCNNSYIANIGNFPLHDISCPCGSSDHWMIKYKEV